jgi:hypothetical protein
MTSEREGFMNILAQNLSEESKWFLWALLKEKRPLHKEELRELANAGFRDMNKGESVTETTLVASRHALDIHTARLEGAGLVNVRGIGRVRMYSLTTLGEELLKFLTNHK